MILNDSASRLRAQHVLFAAAAVSVLSLLTGVGIGSRLAGESLATADTRALIGRRDEPGVAWLELAPPLEPASAGVLMGPETGRIYQVPGLDFESAEACGPDPSPCTLVLSLREARASALQLGSQDGLGEVQPVAGPVDAALATTEQVAALTSNPVQPGERTQDPLPHAVAASPVEPTASRSVRTRSTAAEPLQGSSASGRFVVQAGVFESEGNARILLKQLRARGVEGVVVRARQASGAAAFHVVLGRFGSWRDAERARLQLSRDKQIEVFSRRLMPVPAPQVATL